MYNKIPIVRLEEFKKVERLLKIVSENDGFEYPLGYIAGGFPRVLCSPRQDPAEFRDVDIFTTSLESYHKLVDILNHQEKLEVKIETKMSITFKTSTNEAWKDCPMINLIKPQKNDKLLTFGTTLEEILDNFDFSICRAGILDEGNCLVDSNFLQDEKKKRLRIMKMESPVACIARICKYSGKGYRISIPDIMDILKEWNDRGSEYHKKLFDALDRHKNKKYYSGYSRDYEGESPYIGLEDIKNALNNGTAIKDRDFKLPETEEVLNPNEESWFGIEDSNDLYDLIKIG